MFLAMHTWMRAEPLSAAIRRLPKYGYDAVEIAGRPEAVDVASTRTLLKETGIHCFGAVTLMTPDRSLLSRDPQRRAATVQYVHDCITMVKELGGEEISVVPGSVGQLTAEAPPEDEWRWAVESLQECHDFAVKSGVRIGIEPINRFETFFINRCSQALALADAVSSECGICLDAFHMNIEEADVYAAIRAARGRLVDFHIGDSNRLAPGMGSLDWPTIVATLREIGYDGALSVEFCPPFDRTPANPYPDALETNLAHLDETQRKFLEDHGSGMMSERFYCELIQRSAKALLPLCD